jgi:hypothetical protein
MKIISINITPANTSTSHLIYKTILWSYLFSSYHSQENNITYIVRTWQTNNYELYVKNVKSE